MPGIGMGNKYSWSEPPTFTKMPGDYDYMSGAIDYAPKDLSKVESSINSIIDDIYSTISTCSTYTFNGTDLTNLSMLWNDLFLLDGERQVIVDNEKLNSISEQIEGGYIELSETVKTYFKDAKIAIDNIKGALSQLENNAKTYKKALQDINSKDIDIKSTAESYIHAFERFGKEYDKSKLKNIGKWVY